MEIKLTSTAFEQAGMIPPRYTCDGEDVSPALNWDSVPETAKSLALVCDDPDAPMGTFVHWVLYNLPGDVRELPEDVPAEASLPNGARQGTSDFGQTGYGGPCPPRGTHRYFFRIYALDTPLDLAAGASRAELLEAMEGHILAQGQLMGKYQRR